MNMVRYSGLLVVAIGLALLDGCSNGGVNPQEDSGITPDQGNALDRGDPAPFTADPRPASAGVWLERVPGGDQSLEIQIWAVGLGPVFGLSLGIVYDQAHLQLDTVSQAGALGLDAAGEAIYLITRRPGEVSLGGVRRGPLAGEADLSEPTLLGTLELVSLTAGQSTLGVVDLMVRRVDGSFVAAEGAGGVVRTVGGAS